MVLGEPVDFLVCSESRGSRICRLNIHPERCNSLCKLNAHCKENDLVHQKEVVDLVDSMRIAGRVTSCTAAILIFQVSNQCKQAQA